MFSPNLRMRGAEEKIGEGGIDSLSSILIGGLFCIVNDNVLDFRRCQRFVIYTQIINEAVVR